MELSLTQEAQTLDEIFLHPDWYRALTLAERLCLRRTHPETYQQATGERTEQAIQQFERWQQLYLCAEDGSFAERLALDDTDLEELLAILAEPAELIQARSQGLPDWLAELKQIFSTPAFFQEVFPWCQAQMLRSKQTFLPVLSPFLAWGTQHLQAGMDALHADYPDAPWQTEALGDALLAYLAGRLLALANRVFTLELNIARLEGRLTGETPDERFQSFLTQTGQRERLLALLEEYAPLARLLMVTLANWLSSNLECLRRLCADWSEISQVMQPGDTIGLLSEVQGGAGDSHRQGRSTLILRFSSGWRLLYKPRSLAVDLHFQELLQWLNERGDHPPFRVMKLIERGTYGWSEFIECADCATPAEVERFYTRQGGYLALFYALEATDIHLENLIAAGEHPMMIDLEALFHPRLRVAQNGANAMALETLGHSVLRVGLLPLRIWGNREQRGIDVSGLGGKGGQLHPQPSLQAEARGTDQMHFIRQRMTVPEQQNRPRLAGVAMDVLDYRECLLEGFASVYRLCMDYRSALLAGPFRQFAQDEARVIARPTALYAQLLQESYHPDLLRDMLDRDRFFDHLWVRTVQQRPLRRLLRSEVADLHNLDIPLFTIRPALPHIYTSGGVCLPDFLAETGLQAAQRCLNTFDEHDLARQLWFIRASLTSMVADTEHSELRITTPPLSLAECVTSRDLSASLLQQARAIGDRLCDQALYSEHGANWIGLTYLDESGWTLAPAGADLYSGGGGIALFLAYLGYVTGAEKYTACARAALAFVDESVKEWRERVQSPGGYNGWGGMVYLYSHLGVLWQQRDLLTRARALAGRFAELVSGDEVLDVIGGSAGGIAGLLSLYQAAPAPEVLAMALLCGERLLAASPQCNPTPANLARPHALIAASRPLTGFAHGAAGIALNLLRLAGVSGDERFRQGAIRAIAYEQQTFSPQQQNWPDFRLGATDQRAVEGGAKVTSMLAWCYGAPGIGLARLASLPFYDTPAIRDEIQVALQTTLAQGFGGNHSLCHGDAGNLETLLVAARTLGDAHYQDELERRSVEILASMATHGWLTGLPLALEAPALMTGIAGTGYELLRLSAPDRVPSVLTLELPAPGQPSTMADVRADVHLSHTCSQKESDCDA